VNKCEREVKLLCAKGERKKGKDNSISKNKVVDQWFGGVGPEDLHHAERRQQIVAFDMVQHLRSW
jgi:hypothetical protein